MSKPTKKRNSYNADILNKLQEKYDVTKRFITMSICGERGSEKAEMIKADYKLLLIQHAKQL